MGVLQPIEVDVPDELAVALDHRWAEDAAFSTDNRRLALAGYSSQNIVVLDIEVSVEPTVQVSIHGLTVIRSEQLALPHGLSFLDGGLLAVANRQGAVLLFDLPPSSPDVKELTLDPVLVIGGEDDEFVASPGSVMANPLAPGLFELLVCNNYVHRVTRHVIDTSGPVPQLVSNRVLVAAGLSVPDGVALSPDRRVLLVSNHDRHSSSVYDNDAALGPTAEHIGELGGVGHPHGAEFTPDGRHVLIADAGQPVVHVFRDDGRGWHGEHLPVASVRVVTDDDYQRSVHMPGEGGPKGLSLDATGRVLLLVGQFLHLSFYDTAWFTGEPLGPTVAADRVRAERDLLLREAAHATELRGRIDSLECELAEQANRVEVLEKLVNGLFGRVTLNPPDAARSRAPIS